MSEDYQSKSKSDQQEKKQASKMIKKDKVF